MLYNNAQIVGWILLLNRAHVGHWCQLKVENQCWQGFKLCLSTSQHFPLIP
ncbi:hypothetical protein MC7420_7728 [Coleofasciculus chthonoplastes PCC 7420]|uniref:Uncharacterized protein n=1 Tax=Coleofasciculus chthonoplastes PCC 7420 TaxID=118168 RepID=B4VIS7_9CYAN|nr:hypothetical protein MC7420_7728 [Coleofasciculus chthonoplastes PCC 7420]